jgi:hypothetical protein
MLTVLETLIPVIVIIGLFSLGVVAGASLANETYDRGVEADIYTCNLIEERLLRQIDQLEEAKDVGDVSGLTTALWIVRDVAEE